MPRIQFNTKEAPAMPFRLLLLSDFGVGKTWSIGYIDKKLKELTGRGLLYFDFDIGHQTLSTAHYDVDTISYFVDPERKGVTFEEFDQDFHQYTHPWYLKKYAGFAIDSLTSLQACAMDYVFSINKINRRLNMANENDYGVLVNVMSQMMPQILNIGKHAVFIMAAHTRERENKLTKEIEILPAISGRSLPSQIGAWFNEVWYLHAEGYEGNVDRLAQTAAGNQVDCKTQTAGMPFNIKINEAIDKIMEAYDIKSMTIPEAQEPQQKAAWE